ncbi:hypothetical protein BC938DRAFT_481191, partial [Jimgerdemannia flammicorona]
RLSTRSAVPTRRNLSTSVLFVRIYVRTAISKSDYKPIGQGWERRLHKRLKTMAEEGKLESSCGGTKFALADTLKKILDRDAKHASIVYKKAITEVMSHEQLRRRRRSSIYTRRHTLYPGDNKASQLITVRKQLQSTPTENFGAKWIRMTKVQLEELQRQLAKRQTVEPRTLDRLAHLKEDLDHANIEKEETSRELEEQLPEVGEAGSGEAGGAKSRLEKDTNCHNSTSLAQLEAVVGGRPGVRLHFENDGPDLAEDSWMDGETSLTVHDEPHSSPARDVSDDDGDNMHMEDSQQPQYQELPLLRFPVHLQPLDRPATVDSTLINSVLTLPDGTLLEPPATPLYDYWDDLQARRSQFDALQLHLSQTQFERSQVQAALDRKVAFLEGLLQSTADELGDTENDSEDSSSGQNRNTEDEMQARVVRRIRRLIRYCNAVEDRAGALENRCCDAEIDIRENANILRDMFVRLPPAEEQDDVNSIPPADLTLLRSTFLSRIDNIVSSRDVARSLERDLRGKITEMCARNERERYEVTRAHAEEMERMREAMKMVFEEKDCKIGETIKRCGELLVAKEGEVIELRRQCEGLVEARDGLAVASEVLSMRLEQLDVEICEERGVWGRKENELRMEAEKEAQEKEIMRLETEDLRGQLLLEREEWLWVVNEREVAERERRKDMERMIGMVREEAETLKASLADTERVRSETHGELIDERKIHEELKEQIGKKKLSIAYMEMRVGEVRREAEKERHVQEELVKSAAADVEALQETVERLEGELREVADRAGVAEENHQRAVKEIYTRLEKAQIELTEVVTVRDRVLEELEGERKSRTMEVLRLEDMNERLVNAKRVIEANLEVVRKQRDCHFKNIDTLNAQLTNEQNRTKARLTQLATLKRLVLKSFERIEDVDKYREEIAELVFRPTNKTSRVTASCRPRLRLS